VVGAVVLRGDVIARSPLTNRAITATKTITLAAMATHTSLLDFGGW